MCPACITTAALIAAGAGSSGGLAGLVARTLRRKRKSLAPAAAKPNPLQPDTAKVTT